MTGIRLPGVDIDADGLASNARTVVKSCHSHGVGVTAVTKVVCADPRLATVIWDAGITSLGDSRLENLHVLRETLPSAELVLLRLPMPAEADDVVELADISLNSEPETLTLLDGAARRARRRHRVILMVDVGDLREGIWPDEVQDVASRIRHLNWIDVVGVGTNLACYGGVAPDEANMAGLLSVRDELSTALDSEVPIVSGGNSANWILMESGRMPAGVNHLRLGEAVFLGMETVGRTPISGLAGDIFTLRAQVIEARTKPSVPIGDVGQDSFGGVPEFEDRGNRRRAIVAVGRQDVVPEGLRPLTGGARIIGASSDHMILDVEDAAPAVNVGDVMSFNVWGYSALLALFTSRYVGKRMI